jgi:predicted esterase
VNQIRNRVALGSLLLIATAVLTLAGTIQGRAAIKTVLFISEVVPGIPIKPLDWLTHTPERDRIHFPIQDGLGTADIFRPATENPRGAILVFLGVAPAGPADSRVIGLGEALARNNIVTMFYWSPAMSDKTIQPDDINNLIHAFEYLHSQDYVDPERVGMAGFCVGASFTLIAAAHKSIRDKVAFIHAFGPYFDMTELVKDIASNSRPYGETREPWEVDPLTYEVFVKELTKSLAPQEALDLRTHFLSGKANLPHLTKLSTHGKQIQELLRSVYFEDVETHLSRLPQTLLDQFDHLSPKFYIRDLRAPIHVMHDYDDPLIPSNHSRTLITALDPDTTRYTEFLMFRHMDPDRQLNPLVLSKELAKLFLHLQPLFSHVS